MCITLIIHNFYGKIDSIICDCYDSNSNSYPSMSILSILHNNYYTLNNIMHYSETCLFLCFLHAGNVFACGCMHAREIMTVTDLTHHICGHIPSTSPCKKAGVSIFSSA